MFDRLRKFCDNLFMGWGIGSRPNNQKGNVTMTQYTDAMVARIQAAAPLNLEKAHALSGELGVSYRSVIAKAKSLGVEYVAKAPAAKKAKSDEPTKAETLAAIRTALALPNREGDLTKAELSAVLGAIA